jgi:hypothetical protein
VNKIRLALRAVEASQKVMTVVTVELKKVESLTGRCSVFFFF